MSTRALLFHISIPCDKTLTWTPIYVTRDPWPWSVTYIFTLLITFEKWVLELSCLIFHFSIHCDKTFHQYQRFWLCDLDLGVDQFFENFNLTTNFWAVSARALMHVFHMYILCDNIFSLVPNIFDPVTLTFEIGLLFENFNLATNYKQWVQEFHLNNPCNQIFLLNLTFDLFFKKMAFVIISKW